MLAKFNTWPLPSCVFELVSHAAARYAFSFVPDLQKGLVLSHVSCHSRSPTRSVLEQNYDPCSLSSSYLCRMQTYCHLFRQKKNDPGKMFDMAAATNAAATVRSTSLVGLFLLRECALPTRVTPLLISCRSYADGAVYAVVVLLSMSNGVLYQVRTLHPIGNIVLYQVPRVNQPFN